MYLSRLILNPSNRRVQRELANQYELHRSVLRAFPDNLKEADERVLFRLDADPHSAVLMLLVQSSNAPNWSWLDDAGARGYLLRPPETKAFDLALAAGQRLAFRLRANPTIKRKFDDGAHKRVGIYREEEQLEWLRRKGEQGGFSLLSARASRETIARGVIHRHEETHNLALLAVQFDGLLQVTDPACLRGTVRQGVGSGKGLGFGLLSLAPPAP